MVATPPYPNYKVLLFWICVLFFLSSESLLCQAQVKKFHGYVFSGVAAGSGFTDPIVGGGAEVLIGGGFGIAADSAVYIGEGGDAHLVTLLFGAIYMFHPEHQTVPFVRAGVAGYALTDGAGGGHFGGGVNHWFSEHLGLRVEANALVGDINSGEIRFGLLIQ